jgi:hypothetical protein
VVSENFTRRMMLFVSVWRMLIDQKPKPNLDNMKSQAEVLFLICAEGDLFYQWRTAFFIDKTLFYQPENYRFFLDLRLPPHTKHLKPGF